MRLHCLRNQTMKWCKALKNDIKPYSNGIKSAASLDDLSNLSTEVINLKRDFSAKKEILDQSLYPENYTSSIDKLLASIELRQTDFTEIDVLNTEVTSLKSEVDLLNQRNNELINQITKLESQRRKDAASIEKLENLVADLRVQF
jgi:chromosome segregation ATPase